MHPTALTFDYLNGITMKGVESPPADPDGWTNIGKYVDIQGLGSSVITRLWIHYNTEDVINKNETGLLMYRYNGSHWVELPEPKGVNTDDRYVYAEGITSFSTFAPLTEKFSTYLELPDVTGYRNDVYEFRAVLRDSDGNGVSGREIRFFVNGTEIGRSTTSISGIAIINHTLSEAAGVHNLSALFEGDEVYKASENDTATLKVNKRPTDLTVNSAVGVKGQDVELAARLTSDGMPVAGEIIRFTFEGESYDVATGDDGWARMNYTINLTPGRHDIGVEFHEADSFLESTGTGVLAVNRRAENLTVNPLSGVAPLNITAAATVTNIGDLPYNYTAVLYVDGVAVDNKTIEVPSNATAPVNFTVTLQPGIYNVTIDELENLTVTVYRGANITVDDLRVIPASGAAPLRITVNATLTNTGDLEGTYIAELRVNGVTRTTQNLTVGPGETRTVNFTWTLQAGTYAVTVDNLSPVSVVVRSPGISIKGIASAVNAVKIYYERYGRLPSTITVEGHRFTMGEFLYLLCRATINLNRGDLLPVAPRKVGSATAPSGRYMHGKIYRSEYVRVAGYIVDFINRYARAPNYAVTGLGRIPFSRLTYMYSKIIGFYHTNRRLPAYVLI